MQVLGLIVVAVVLWLFFRNRKGTSAQSPSPSEDQLLQQIDAQGLPLLPTLLGTGAMVNLPSYSPNDPNAPWNSSLARLATPQDWALNWQAPNWLEQPNAPARDGSAIAGSYVRQASNTPYYSELN